MGLATYDACHRREQAAVVVVVGASVVVVVLGSVVVTGTVVVEPAGVLVVGLTLVPAGQSIPPLMHFATNASSAG